MTRFFPAYKISDLAELSSMTLDVMWQCITMIEAQEQLKAMTIADWPNMKKAQRQKLHKDLFRQAFPRALKQKNIIELSDLQKVLGR